MMDQSGPHGCAMLDRVQNCPGLCDIRQINKNISGQIIKPNFNKLWRNYGPPNNRQRGQKRSYRLSGIYLVGPPRRLPAMSQRPPSARIGVSRKAAVMDKNSEERLIGGTGPPTKIIQGPGGVSLPAVKYTTQTKFPSNYKIDYIYL